ncbi:hypothetical protein CK203_072473 [Vitis vinifera]|uniref:Retrovirus-related Pol polyprotein from transposon TNT 1-94-like beta-barrel domain-containing protein n=1 Tax=Vitis vinifera TaxID=29760 RepID=A0A438F8Y2_VITVI|nr:hypothetical protein CK203_072473 [Vitis vinifera]
MSYSPPESSGPSISDFDYCPSYSNFCSTRLFLQLRALFLHLLHQIMHPRNGATDVNFSIISNGVQGNNSTKLWYVDSGASNHMTNNPTALCHVRPYAGQSSIQTANASSLPIAAISDAYSKFTDVFLAPQLSMNLISVGQLVDNNCVVNFSGNDCVVQD